MGFEGLARLIEKQHEPHLHCHVLIDPLAIPDSGDHGLLAQLRSALGECALTQVPRADLAHARHLYPVLVCLAMPGTAPIRSLLDQTARAAQKGLYQRRRYLCGWLFSEAPSATIASHLAALCRVPDGKGAFGFHPVYEPVRLELLAATYQQVEHGPWWPIDKWLFLSSGGRLVNLKGQGKQRHSLPAPAQRIQDDAGLVQRVLCIWRALRAGASEASPCPIPPFAAVRASNHIDDARALGLNEAEDIVVFALHQLCIHSELHNVTAVHELIASVVRQQRPLAPALACYADEQWRRLTESLPKSESRP